MLSTPEYIEKLRKSGLRPTKQRIKICQVLFDTNTTNHHHFFDEKQKELIDLEDVDVDPVKIKKTIPGKKIKSVEVLVKIDSE